MKLFLASSADKTLLHLKKCMPSVGKQVLFIANASDPDEGEKWWVDNDKTAFEKEGFVVRPVDLRTTTKETLHTLLEEHDVLHVCGGSVFYLLALLRERDLETVIQEAVKKEEVVYTGTSTGSMIVSENLHSASYDEVKAEYLQKVPDMRGLGLVSFSILPHANNPEFTKEYAHTVENMHTENTPLFFLQDNHALWVDDEKITLLSTPY